MQDCMRTGILALLHFDKSIAKRNELQSKLLFVTINTNILQDVKKVLHGFV